MMTLNQLVRCLVFAALLTAVTAVVRPSASDARPTPAIEKNYRLKLTHKTTQSFSDLADEAAESLRVESTMMRTSKHPKVVRWRERLDRMKDLQPLAQLEQVNSLINGTVRYLPDYKHWERDDKWGFPFATLDEGGDCEDFATLKRVSLLYLGWPEESFHLLLGFTTFNRTSQPETHAVLLVTLPDRSQVILDNLEKQLLPPADNRAFTPMMAIDRKAFYLVGRT